MIAFHFFGCHDFIVFHSFLGCPSQERMKNNELVTAKEMKSNQGVLLDKTIAKITKEQLIGTIIKKET